MVDIISTLSSTSPYIPHCLCLVLLLLLIFNSPTEVNCLSGCLQKIVVQFIITYTIIRIGIGLVNVLPDFRNLLLNETQSIITIPALN
jgi:hypothetical protein